MALKKEIRQNDGVLTTYHRILFIQSTVNQQTSIAVLSYVDKTGREMEEGECPPYKSAITYETDYDESMTIKKAYGYLKTLPEFEGAEDVLDNTDDNVTGEDFLSMLEEVM